MEWMNKYQNRDEFLSWFNDEKEYVDAMFVQLIMFNFGVALDVSDLDKEDERESVTD